MARPLATPWRTGFRPGPDRGGCRSFFDIGIVEAVDAVAGELDATPAQVALAWLLAQGEGIVPIPGTKRVTRLEENAGADALVLTPDQLDRLSTVAAPQGDRYADMSSVNR